MADLFGRVFQKGISTDNPRLMQTKADVVKDLVKRGGAPIVKKTHSCWIARQAKHCGRCVPCVVRRFATEAAGVADVKYEQDIFSAPGPVEEDSFANIGDYLLFIRRLSMSTDDDLLFDYPDLNVSGDGDLVAKLLKTHRKWASQVERTIKKYPALDSLY
ncbi:MAG: hypothetical protein DMF97_21505 [Acidobacteria bacterium]|nr:MAG: hypothetical protein DMF97_21505 [Acidobacteriota bacterium]